MKSLREPQNFPDSQPVGDPKPTTDVAKVDSVQALQVVGGILSLILGGGLILEIFL